MEVYKSFRYRLYPNSKQQKQINKTLGCARFIYNLLLEHCYSDMSINNKWPSYEDCANQLPSLKEKYPWLKEVDSIALQQSLRDLKQAHVNYIKSRKEGKTTYGKPRFKSKHDNECRYRTQNVNNNICLVGNRIKFPKLGNVTISKSRDVNGGILRATITRTCTGKYYVTLCVQCNVEEFPASQKEIGLDMGLKVFLHDSDDIYKENPHFLKKDLRSVKRAQRTLSRKKKGSNNWKKQKRKLAGRHEKVTNKRTDFLHKQSFRVVKENQLIAVESLKVKNMLKNHCLAGAISDVSWSRFLRMLDYKAKWYGRTFVKIASNYPSSQICSVCGRKEPKLKDLSIREWICPECGSKHDRDHNAACNILKEAKRILQAA